MNGTVADPGMTRLTSLSLSTFLLVAHAAVVMGAQPTARAGLQEVVNTGMQCKHIPGLALALVSNGQVLESRGYGVKDLDTREAVTSDTKFLVASLTKAFTATLLTHVMKEHRASYRRQMSTNVKYLLQGLRFNNTLRSTYATLEDLLAHRTGIPRNNYVRLASDFSMDTFSSKIRYLPSKGGFRDSFYYSDIMYGLSAHITQTLTGGTPWKQQIRDVLFNPLGMANSSFVDDVDFTQDDVATPYLRENQRTVKASVDFIKHWGRNQGSGNIMSSASDMARWMLTLLNGGRDPHDDSLLVGEGVVEDTFTAQNFLRPASYALKYRKPRSPHSFTADNYGLGWRLGYYRGYQMVYHSGSSFGYRAYLTLLPEMQIGAVTLMTGSDPDYKLRTALHTHLMDRALGVTPWINATNICSFPESHASDPAARPKRSADGFHDKFVEDEEEAELEMLLDQEESGMTPTRVRRGARAVPSLPLQSYVGSYQHAAYGSLTVGFNSTAGALELQYGIGQWQLTLNSGQDFDGRWLKEPPTISARFKFFSKSNSVHAVEVTSFEPTLPPVFHRH